MNVTHATAAVAALDLSTVRTRLMHPRAGLGWTDARTRAAESDYREFLVMAKLLPDDTPIPTPDVDSFWHFHILDTMRYACDCASALGYFLHHRPDVEFDEDDAPDIHLRAYCSLTGSSFTGRGSMRSKPSYCSRARLQTHWVAPLC